VYSSRGNATNGSQRLLAAEFKGLQPLAENSVELLAIFLQPASRSILLDALAPRHAHVLAEHITLSFRPSGDVLHEAAPIVGQPVAIKINLSACLRSNRVDAVPVVISDEVIRRFVVSGSPHLTLSKIPQADASESLGLLKEALFSQEPPSFLELTGIVGLQCASGSLGNATPSLVSLGSKTREIVEELVANGQPGQTLKLKGLSGAERMIIHEYAAHVGISHESEGQKKQGGGKKKGREGVKKKDSEATSDGGRVLMLKLPAGWSGVELDLGYNSTPRGENSRIFSSANEIDRPANSKNSIGQEQKTSQVIYNLDHFDSGSSCGDGDCGVGGVERSAHGQILEGGRVLWFSKGAPTLPSQCLRRAIMGEHDKERRLVVILRGIPGSGKSTFASQMASEWGAKVSADEYFERGAGVLSKRQLKEMSASEVYAACFDVKKLEEAHEYCKEQFVKMVVQRASPIVVDNSNVKKSEYAFYTNCAKESGYAVLVVEVSDTLGEQKTFGAHQVPWPVITKMRKSWETDEDAIKLIGWCAKTTPLGGKTEALAAGGRRLTHWLGEHKGAVHTIKERKKTHLSMEAAGNRVHFLNVPEHLLTEFYEACACDSSPRYLCEAVDASENFRMFLDVDLPREDSSANDFEWIQRVVNAIPTALAACGVGDGGGGGERSEWGEAIVVGAQGGFHVKLPRVEVSRNEALAVREALVRTLVASSSGAASAKGVLPPDWAGVIDESVYTHLTCRMLGSRKATKGRDVGRVYSLKAVFDLNDAAHASGAGVSSIQRLSEVEEMYHQNMAGLLAKCSIRIPALARAGAAEGEAREGRL
jgi:predicted kinase